MIARYRCRHNINPTLKCKLGAIDWFTTAYSERLDFKLCSPFSSLKQLVSHIAQFFNYDRSIYYCGLLVEQTGWLGVLVYNHGEVRQWLTACLKTDTFALTASVNKTQIKISLSLYPFQITSWSGWIAARVTSTPSWSRCQNPEVELVPWQMQMLTHWLVRMILGHRPVDC